MEIENSVFAAGKFQHEQALRRAKIKLDVTSAHAWIFRRFCVPVTGHRITVGVELWLKIPKPDAPMAAIETQIITSPINSQTGATMHVTINAMATAK